MGMRSENFYYIRTIEKVEIALLDMFNDLKVNKYSGVDRKQIIKSIKVPLVSMTDKNFANWYQNQLAKRKLMPLPIAGLRFKNAVPNPSGRTQSTYLRQIFSKATGQWIRDIQPTPYFLNYTLHFLMDNRSDLGQLMENVLPYFNPDRFLRLYEFDFMPTIPDLERKIQVNLVSNNIEFQDEVQASSAHRYIKFDIDFRCEVELYRPLEIAEMIKYAELNINMDGIIGKHQALIYPTDIVEDGKKPFEETTDSDIKGLSILKTVCKTLVKKVDVDGNITYEDVSAPDCDRPTEVPDIKQIDLWFDVDSDNEQDHSPYHRDFTLLNGATRTFLPGFEPGNGQEVSGGGYEVDPASQWNKILSWFGTNDGLMESPFTFKIKLQFNDNNVTDAVFQQLSNKETDTIPAEKVFFDWGLMESKLYFSFGTFGSKALNYTFKTKEPIDLNNSDVYEFIFALYDEGRAGIFAYRINDSKYIVLNTERTK